MILYHPTESDIYMKLVSLRPKTCFIMTKIGGEVPDQILRIRRSLNRYLNKYKIDSLDAESVITGGDFLIKIWELIASVPLGIAILSEELTSETKSNIFYELGILKTLGKSTLVIKTEDCNIPSDFIRTEYLNFDKKFRYRISKFLKNFLGQADYYQQMSTDLGKNPFIAVDYLKRAYLISGNDEAKDELDSRINSLLEDINVDKDIKKEINLILRQ